ncbi:MAG: hypothetical protein OHK0024_03800 [Thalassobaculales bacterium]
MDATAADAAKPAVKINTRTAESEPDILDIRNPFLDAAVALIDRLAARELAPARYMAEVGRLLASMDLVTMLKPWLERAMAEQRDQVLFRRTGKGHREAIQVFYLAPNVFHPPHCHHNILSTQYMLTGRVQMREYDRIARLSADTLLLKPVAEGWIGPGDALRASEVDRNCHWFCSSQEPALMLNFNAYGYQDWTFNPKDRPLLRNLVDPTHAVSPDGLPIAREISVEEAYAKFGGRPISDFPLP